MNALRLRVDSLRRQSNSLGRALGHDFLLKLSRDVEPLGLGGEFEASHWSGSVFAGGFNLLLSNRKSVYRSTHQHYILAKENDERIHNANCGWNSVDLIDCHACSVGDPGGKNAILRVEPGDVISSFESFLLGTADGWHYATFQVLTKDELVAGRGNRILVVESSSDALEWETMAELGVSTDSAAKKFFRARLVELPR